MWLYGWRTRLKEVDFEKLKQEGRVDYVLLDNLLKYQIALLDRADKQRAEQASLLPFADELLKLQDDRREMKVVDGKQAARVLATLAKQVDSLRLLIEQPQRGGADVPSAAPRPPRAVANRAADEIDRIRNVVNQWYSYYQGYDPMFTWWVENPIAKVNESLASYTRTIRQPDRRDSVVATLPSRWAVGGRAGGSSDAGSQRRCRRRRRNTGGGSMSAEANAPIIGDPIGRDGLMADLEKEMIPYTPEGELIAIAEREYQFSLSEMKKASRRDGLRR